MKNILTILLGTGLVLYFIFKFVLQSRSDLEVAPNFKTELIDGSSFELASLKGSYVLLNFWGSWCGPCRKDIPELTKFYNDYKSANFKDGKDLIVVTVALEKVPDMWKSVAEKANFDWPHQIVHQNKLVMMSSIARKYGVTDIPAKFLIDSKGNIIAKNSFADMRKVLEGKVK